MKLSHIIVTFALLLTVACKDYKAEESRLNNLKAEHLLVIRKTILTRDGNIENKIAFIKKHGEIQAKYREKTKDLSSGTWGTWRRVRLQTQEQKEINEALKSLGFPELVREP